MTDSDKKTMHVLNAILVSIFAFFLLILLGYNSCIFLVKKQKYKRMLHVVFYVTALMTIAFNIVTAWTGFDCAGLNYVIYLAIPYLTLIIANYLAACIKILSLQLEQLIASKNQVLEAQGQEFPDAF